MSGPGSGTGDNSKAAKMAVVDRLERLEDDKRALGEDIKELKQEAKRAGFDPKEIAALAKLKHLGKEAADEAYEAYQANLFTLGWLE